MKWEDRLDLQEMNKDLEGVYYLPDSKKKEGFKQLIDKANKSTAWLRTRKTDNGEFKDNSALAITLLLDGAKPEIYVDADGDLDVKLKSQKRKRPLGNSFLKNLEEDITNNNNQQISK